MPTDCVDSPDNNGQPEAEETPRYLTHTFASKSSGSSQHAEVERLMNSFRSSNYLSLKKLPPSFKPGAVEESKRKSISSGRSSKPENVYRAKSKSIQSAYFTPVTYSRDEYMKVTENDKMDRQNKELTSLSFSRKPFTYATSRIRLKNEDIFGDEKYKFPVLGPGSDVAELETVVRTDFTDASKMLHGPFFVPARVQPECKVSRDELVLWSREVFTRLSEDWPHLRFTLRCVGDDELVVAFDLPVSDVVIPTDTGGAETESNTSDYSGVKDSANKETLPVHLEELESDFEFDDIPTSEPETIEEEAMGKGVNSTLVTSLGRYMNTMALHGVASHRRLRKRGDRWKVFEFEKYKDKENKKESSAKGGVNSGTSSRTGSAGSKGSDQSSAEGKHLLVFSFYTPWFTAATRNIQKSSAKQERLSVRRFVQQARNSKPSIPSRRHSAGATGRGRDTTETDEIAKGKAIRPSRSARLSTVSCRSTIYGTSSAPLPSTIASNSPRTVLND